MINKYLKVIFLKAMSGLVGKKRFQNFFEKLSRFSLLGMNIGGGTNLKDSGERSGLDYINNYFNKINQLIIFDVGANTGNYSNLLREVFGEKAIIHAFEPANKTFQKLSLNLGNKKGINLYNFGLGDENNKVFLFSDTEESGLASIYERRLDHLNIRMNQREEIKIETLDYFCDRNDIKHINLLKIDVEGNEKRVLDGSKKMLSSGKIDFIQFEFGGCNIDSRVFFQDFYYLLKDRYKIYRIVKDGIYPIKQYKEVYESFMTTNYLAERRIIL